MSPAGGPAAGQAARFGESYRREADRTERFIAIVEEAGLDGAAALLAQALEVKADHAPAEDVRRWRALRAEADKLLASVRAALDDEVDVSVDEGEPEGLGEFLRANDNVLLDGEIAALRALRVNEETEVGAGGAWATVTVRRVS